MFEPLLIAASAGSGKTYRLTNRYIALLLAGESPSHILATTFTRKAAGEIRERVLARLAEAVLGDESLCLLQKALSESGVDVSRERVERAFESMLRENHRLNICTLDGLFLKLAQCFSYELGQFPGWKVADDAQLPILEREALQVVCATADESELAQLVQLLHGGDLKRSVHEELEQRVLALHDLFRETEQAAWEWLSPPSLVASDALRQAQEELCGENLPLTAKGVPDKRWQTALEKLNVLVQHGRWREVLEETLVQASLIEMGTYQGRPIPVKLKAAICTLAAQAAAVVLRALKQQTKATWELLNRFAHEFEDRKLRAGLRSFRDISLLLSRAALGNHMEELYFRLDCTLRHVLFDEFQDTSRTDWKVLYPLVSEVLSKESGDHSFLCVGDSKQAIYQWRGGVAEIFDSIRHTWPHIKFESLTESRRSTQAIIDFVNLVFLGVADNVALSQDRSAALEWSARFSQHQTVRLGDGYVRIEVVEGDAGNIANPYEQLCSTIDALFCANPQLEIGVLVRENSSIAEIVESLRMKSPLLPVSAEGAASLSESSAVNLLLALLKVVDHPMCTLSRFHVSGSVVGEHVGLTDFRCDEQAYQVSEKLLASFERDGLTALLQDLVCVLIPQCGRKDAQSLHQVVELSRRVPPGVIRKPSDFIEVVERAKVEGEGRGRVRVMTMHSAKGLEFDAVFLPDLESRIVKNSREEVLVYHDRIDLPPVRVARYAGEGIRLMSEQLADMYDQMRRERIKEGLSLLYVALTRARYGLYIFVRRGRADVYPCSPAGIIRAAVAEKAGESESILYERGNSRWWLFSADCKQMETLPGDVVLTFDVRRGERRRALVRVAPSDYEARQESSIEQMLVLGRQNAIFRGRVIHRLFERVAWIEDGVPGRGELVSVLESMRVPPSEHDGLLSVFYHTLEAPHVRPVFLRSSFEQGVELELLREFPFAIVLDGGVMQGVFDRVVLLRSRGKVTSACVIDFKTGSFSDYDSQMGAYRRAMTAMYSLSPSTVLVQVIFVDSGRVVEI